VNWRVIIVRPALSRPLPPGQRQLGWRAPA
jgi:hypothetical protein